MNIGQHQQQMLPTSHRPIPMRVRPDLIARRIPYRNEGSWVVKDPVSLRYHRLLDEQYHILQSLDAQRSLEDLLREVRREFPTVHLTIMHVQSVVTDLFEKGLLSNDRPGQAGMLIERARKHRRQKLFQTLTSILYLRLPGWDPERTLSRMLPWVRWTFRPWAVAFFCTLIVASWILLAIRFDDFHRTFPAFQQFFGWPNLLYLWLTLSIAKICHEFGHGLFCKYFGGECHEMGIMLLVFSPCLYCDVTDSWLLRNKWQRIAIGAAGMYVELVISAVALFLWWSTDSGMLHLLCFNVVTITMLTTVIFNANPLMRFDGYYMFADWVEIPNLREKATRMLREKFAWYCLGIPAKPDPFLPHSGQNWLALYAIASWLYRWFLLFVITMFLYTFLKPYGLQSIGIALAAFSIGGIVFTMLLGVYHTLKAPRSEPLSHRKIAMSLVVLGLLIAAALKIPFPLYAEAPFVIEPEGGREVRVITPGRLITLKVKPGDRVRKHQVLAVLDNPEVSDRLRALQIDHDVARTQVKMYQSLEDAAGEQLARNRLQGIEAQIEDYKARMEKLTLTAPCDGFVVAPPSRPEPVQTSMEEPLPRWHGTPLDDHNRGCFLDRQTHLLTVAPTKRLVAIALVDQSNRNELEPGQDVELKFDHLPTEIIEGTVESISRRHQLFAPLELSNKSGGDLPTVTDSQGREKLTSAVYPATVPLPGDVQLFRAGMRGRARFLLERRSAGGWAWRYLRKTIQFRF